ncbi:hypothetical protein DZF91_11160 [Actinomadura logoneensis]|uniref:Uncharacterized protein n=1 Tax=Actinomadura logoneensis TaxID=2293572 RepID=A0A372JNI7_9ACTN|nr:hypothetical protein [Actinomadura logoneensis]RFU41601.1 hypothetical protein DZF91_11160 [Actinomadura logoneensis]
MHLDQSVTAETTATGRPVRLIRPDGSSFGVRRVMAEWQPPGAPRLLRLHVTTPGGAPAIAEVTASASDAWRLRQLWT